MPVVSSRMHRRLSRRSGFAYLWALVITAVFAALAALAAPQLARINDAQRVSTTIANLRQVGTALVTFHTVIHSSNPTLNFPGELSQLANAVRPTVDKNSCHANMVARDSTDWTTHGPFVDFMIAPGRGLWTPIGLLRDSIPVRTATAAMFIEMPGVSRSDAALFTAMVDSNATPAGDTVTVTTGAGDTVTIRMRIFAANAFNGC